MIAEGRDLRQDYIGARRLIERRDLYTPFTAAELRALNVIPNAGIWMLLPAFLLTCIPHWQIIEWLAARFGAPFPTWVGFTSPGFYALALLFFLFLRAGRSRQPDILHKMRIM